MSEMKMKMKVLLREKMKKLEWMKKQMKKRKECNA